MDVLDSLSVAQRETLASFQAITNTDNLDTSVTVLNSTDWNLESAIAKIYDREPGAHPTPSSSTPLMEEFGIDDSAVMPPSGASRPVAPGSLAYWLRQFFAVPINVLSWPAGVLYGAAGYVLGFLARLLRIRPGAISLRPRNPFARDPARAYVDPASAAERWVRALEECTGAVRWGRRGERRGSGLRERGERRSVPDFWVGGYESALRRAKEEVKVLMVVLTCDEHEDDAEFKRNVLTDPELLRTLAAEGILCWGGDVRDRDAYQVGKTLSYFTLPFIAFVALQPPSTTSTSTSSPRMTIISRLEGSPSSTTSAPALLTQLTTLVLPRVTPFLSRLRGIAATRNAERLLREEQDRAYNLAATRDTERVLARRAEEDRKRRDGVASIEREARIGKLRDQGREWRNWMRGRLGDEPGEGARIGVRLGDGRRAVRKFGEGETVEKVYAFVECALEEGKEGEGVGGRKPEGYEHVYEFRLATTFPRVVLEIDGGMGARTVGSWGEALVPSGNLVVEGLKRRESLGEEESDDDDDDGDDE